MVVYRNIMWVILVALMWLPLSTMAETLGQCEVCGKAVTESSNWFIIAKQGGEEITYGCAGCGLSALAGMSQDDVVAARAEDFLRRVLIDAEDAYYLRDSEVGFCCEPYWLAFASREEAEKFADGFGGEILDYEAALKKAPEDHPHGHSH